MRFRHHRLFSGLVLVPILGLSDAPAHAQTRDAAPPPAAGRKIDFGKDIRSILEVSCTSCHGPDKQKSGLRLDRRAAAIA